MRLLCQPIHCCSCRRDIYVGPIDRELEVCPVCGTIAINHFLGPLPVKELKNKRVLTVFNYNQDIDEYLVGDSEDENVDNFYKAHCNEELFVEYDSSDIYYEYCEEVKI